MTVDEPTETRRLDVRPSSVERYPLGGTPTVDRRGGGVISVSGGRDLYASTQGPRHVEKRLSRSTLFWRGIGRGLMGGAFVVMKVLWVCVLLLVGAVQGMIMVMVLGSFFTGKR